jgi:hypothetical protein
MGVLRGQVLEATANLVLQERGININDDQQQRCRDGRGKHIVYSAEVDVAWVGAGARLLKALGVSEKNIIALQGKEYSIDGVKRVLIFKSRDKMVLTLQEGLSRYRKVGAIFSGPKSPEFEKFMQRLRQGLKQRYIAYASDSSFTKDIRPLFIGAAQYESVVNASDTSDGLAQAYEALKDIPFEVVVFKAAGVQQERLKRNIYLSRREFLLPGNYLKDRLVQIRRTTGGVNMRARDFNIETNGQMGTLLFSAAPGAREASPIADYDYLTFDVTDLKNMSINEALSFIEN